MVSIFRYIFALIILCLGVFDLTQPESLKNAMHAIEMPSYLLIILGVAKILGSLALIFNFHWRLREWAFAGFFIWAFGGIFSHLLVGHALTETLPLLGLLALLSASYVAHLKATK